MECAVALLKQTIPKMIRIEARLEPDLSPVQTNPNQIEQVLLNLATNAADAMPEGRVLTFATTSALLSGKPCVPCLEPMEGAYTVLSVSDTGQGMSHEVQERIFDPFFNHTTKEVGKGHRPGPVHGLRHHQGPWRPHPMRQRPGPGHGFFRILPSRPRRRPSSPSPNEPGHEIILLVDDDEALVELGARMLKASGYTVLTAGSGEEALRVFEPDPPSPESGHFGTWGCRAWGA